MSYTRILPRDLFNEAKLLKCLGFVVLKIHDGELQNIEFEHDGESFDIHLSNDNFLYVSNLRFYIKGEYTEICFQSNYNSRSNFPLTCEYESELLQVFNDDGTFTSEFLAITEKELVS